MSKPVRVGVVGCGAISGAYLGMAKNFPNVEMFACADLDPARAAAAAEKFGVANVLSVEQLLAHPDIEMVLNLTIPKAHAPVALQALATGKHTYMEKPLGVNREEGAKVIDAARAKNLRVGCAPDTFMGSGIQTARKVIDDGVIGRPVAFTALMQGRGHEHWHPSPEFYYEPGGGPMFDMGPYYLTALLNLLGPVKRISGMSTIAIPERTITSQPKAGKKITVQTPDHIVGLMEFTNGAVGTIIQSFATVEGGHDGSHPIIINGTDGAVRVPDPNTFDGTVIVRRHGEKDSIEVPSQFHKGYGRSVGLADMAVALRSGRAHRANGEQALAVLDLMQGFLDSSTSGRMYEPRYAYERPAAMRADLPFGQLEP
ncbi:MAG TPA: Gfo/Idh/MocA family oxidoreductase [Tepidisphaeraceae bacterium]|nr:Gfo/Idh/MocA family oxidoreductase [Tepidisphaeraceae bacterium]